MVIENVDKGRWPRRSGYLFNKTLKEIRQERGRPQDGSEEIEAEPDMMGVVGRRCCGNYFDLRL